MPLIFLNAHPVTVADGATAIDALAAADPGLAEAYTRGEAWLTDGRGIAVPPDTPLVAGDILRAAARARRTPEADADA